MAEEKAADHFTGARFDRDREIAPNGKMAFGLPVVRPPLTVSRIFRDIADANCLSSSGRRASDTLVQRNAKIRGKIGRITDGETVLERPPSFFHKQHTENFVIDMSFDKRGGSREYFIEIERGVYFLADFGQGCEHFRGNFTRRPD